MSEAFDPRRVQADYLRASGFRDRLVQLVGYACGSMGPSYLFSPENEAARVRASLILSTILDGFTPTPSLHSYHPAANAFIVYYGLGEPITRKELGLEVV